MSLLVLAILATVTWLLWAVGGILALRADKLEHKRPQDAGFSIAPIIPLFPLLAVLLTFVMDKVAAPWGTRTIGGVHAMLMLVFAIGIARELYRLRSANRDPASRS